MFGICQIVIVLADFFVLQISNLSAIQSISALRKHPCQETYEKINAKKEHIVDLWNTISIAINSGLSQSDVGFVLDLRNTVLIRL